MYLGISKTSHKKYHFKYVLFLNMFQPSLEKGIELRLS